VTAEYEVAFLDEVEVEREVVVVREQLVPLVFDDLEYSLI